MTPTLQFVIYMTILSWLTGLVWALGTRDTPPANGPTAFTGRVERTARNTMENLVFFVAIALVAHAAGVDGANTTAAKGAALFFWARVVYVPVYYAGIAYVRTAVFAVSLAGLAMMLSAVL